MGNTFIYYATISLPRASSVFWHRPRRASIRRPVYRKTTSLCLWRPYGENSPLGAQTKTPIAALSIAKSRKDERGTLPSFEPVWHSELDFCWVGHVTLLMTQAPRGQKYTDEPGAILVADWLGILFSVDWVRALSKGIFERVRWLVRDCSGLAEVGTSPGSYTVP